MPDLTDFGKNLKNILEERGINQKWLADAAETKEATISRYVNGVNKSSRLDILVKIAKALNVTTDYLLGLSDVPQPKAELNAEERIMLFAMRRTSDRDLNLIWSILEAYLTPKEKELISDLEQIEKQDIG